MGSPDLFSGPRLSGNRDSWDSSRARSNGAGPELFEHHQSRSLMNHRTPSIDPGRLSILLFFVAAFACFASGCITDQAAQAETAWQSGNRDRAFEYYEALIADGSRDPLVFYRAGKVSVDRGLFAQAERYYSQALRYGGGPEVARALADYYVQTSNFIAAVRVYQYLLRYEEDVQPVYSNIGAALMYGNKFVDAESHLLIAQQMNPKDPVPYLNLGVLYDRHIRNHPRAKSFYQCFLELAPDSRERGIVGSRLREFEQFYQVDSSRVGLVCGEVFRVGEPDRIDLKQVFDLEFGVDDDDEEGGEIEIERLVPSQVEDERSPEPRSTSRTLDDRRDRESFERAARLAQAGHFDRALQALGDRPWDEYDYREREIIIDSLEGMGRNSEAVERLEETLEEGPSPRVVERLLRLYEETGETRKRDELCDRFLSWPNYRDVIQSCK